MTKKHPKSRPTSNTAISQPFLQETLPVLSSFSQDGTLFAIVTLAVDKHRMRVFNAGSGRAIAEYTIQSGRVSSLIWSTFTLDHDILSEETSPARKRKKKRAEDGGVRGRKETETLVVTIGLSDGTILLFSASHSNVIRTLSHASSTAAIISLTSSTSNRSLLWSSSADSSVQLWDVNKGTVLRGWKNDDRIPYTSLTIRPSSDDEDETNLLAAHHKIHLLTDPYLSTSTKPKQPASFTGHATAIKVLRWIKSTATSRKFFSAAEGDRYVYMWDAEDASMNEKPVASVSLDSDVRTFALDASNPSRQTLMTLSSSGNLAFIPIPTDFPSSQSTSEKSTTIHTLLPRSMLRSRKSGQNFPPIIDFAPALVDKGTVRVVRLVNGIQPVFDVVRYLDDTGKYDQNLVLDEIRDCAVDGERQVISTKRYVESASVGVGSGIDPNQLDEIRDSATQREIDGSLQTDLAELSLGQRLAAVADNGTDTSSDSEGNEVELRQKKSKTKTVKGDISTIPSNSLTRTLIQALHSSDSRLLEMCLAHSDSLLIRNTVRRLPPQLAIPLINACVERLGRGARGANMKGRGGGASSQRGMGLLTWINTVLAVHTGHMMTIPDIVARLSGLYTTLTARQSLHESLLSLSGRLDTVLSQVEYRAATSPRSLAHHKAAANKNEMAIKRYVEGESESEAEMDAEIELDEGSVEDIELGGENGSDSEEESSENEFIDDEADEDEEGYSDEEEEESE